MAFHEVQFPPGISLNMVGGSRRPVDVVTLDSGREERNATWAAPRRAYDIGYGLRQPGDLETVVAFYEAREGKLHGFRFKDWTDYRSCVSPASPTATDQAIGTGDGAAQAFQLVKTYSSAAVDYVRSIAKPVSGTVLIALDGTPQASGWTVDTATGIVTFDVAPGIGVAITAGFEFDVPVRFDTDQLDVSLQHSNAGAIPDIPLIEVFL